MLTPAPEYDRDDYQFFMRASFSQPFADGSVVRVHFTPVSFVMRQFANLLMATKQVERFRYLFEPKLDVKRFASSKDASPAFCQTIPLGRNMRQSNLLCDR